MSIILDRRRITDIAEKNFLSFQDQFLGKPDYPLTTMTISRVILRVCVTWICICLCTCTRGRCVRARKGGSRLNVADGRFDGQGEKKVSKVGQDCQGASTRGVEMKWNEDPRR